ncbi:DNA cytosine methyltransferase [Flavobacteriaceae bacterium]|nr:DNA cytosine methyltransferase [Flavobacteriaceae bacterium]
MNNFIDLFSGAGGLSEGFIKAGYSPIAHVEIDRFACDTLKTRAAYHYLKKYNQESLYYDYLHNKISRDELWNSVPKEIIESVINIEISKKNLNHIFDLIDKSLQNKKVDIIIGGPPCQAYSIAGRARDPNGMADDPRNHLYKFYAQFLKKYKPKMFVFENVPGILSASNGEFLQKIFRSFNRAGYKIKIPPKNFLNAKNFNVLQDRKRVIMIGFKKEYNFEYPKFDEIETKYSLGKSLLSDLPKLKNGEGSLGVTKYLNQTTRYLEETQIRNGIDFTTQHIVRPNNDTDLEIYRIAVDLLVNKGEKLKYPDLPARLIKHKNINSFTNRFKVVNPNGISSTIVAHIAMDGHYFIHPDIEQNRSISVREAARIQSFPDDYFFEGSRSAAYRQIGNAVPPLMAEVIAKKLKELI